MKCYASMLSSAMVEWNGNVHPICHGNDVRMFIQW